MKLHLFLYKQKLNVYPYAAIKSMCAITAQEFMEKKKKEKLKKDKKQRDENKVVKPKKERAPRKKKERKSEQCELCGKESLIFLQSSWSSIAWLLWTACPC